VIQEQVFSALAPLVSGRVYPNTAPDKPTTPYIVYTRVASTPENTLDDGQSIQQTRLQIDIYDKTYAGVQALAQLVEAALTVAPIGAIQLLDQDQYEPEVKLHRVIHDYSIWHY
jgi:hypothetical protein